MWQMPVSYKALHAAIPLVTSISLRTMVPYYSLDTYSLLSRGRLDPDSLEKMIGSL